MYILRLNNRELFHSPNINLVNNYNKIHGNNSLNANSFLRNSLPITSGLIILANYDGTSLTGWTLNNGGTPKTTIDAVVGNPASSIKMDSANTAFYRDFGSSMLNKTIQWDVRFGIGGNHAFLFGGNSLANNVSGRYCLKMSLARTNQGFASNDGNWNFSGNGITTTAILSVNTWYTVKVQLASGINGCKWFINGLQQTDTYTWVESLGNYYFGWIDNGGVCNIDNIYIYDGLV